jgi:protein subunit release factor A
MGIGLPELIFGSLAFACHNRRSTMKRLVEIRAAEGGEDSKLFVKDLAAAYQKHFTRVG